LKGGDSFKNVLGIKAADFLAWEVRKSHLNINEWWENSPRERNPIEAAQPDSVVAQPGQEMAGSAALIRGPVGR